MAFSVIELWIGVFLVIAIISLAVKYSRGRETLDDQKVLDILRKELQDDITGSYEISSIVSLDESHITTVIVHTQYYDLAVEIDNISGKILRKEKLIR